jgi:predicted nuclease of predicted toxin-antitoxin system
MKLVLDMNLSPALADLLVAAGFDAVHWSKIGAPNATDAHIMSRAIENGFIVVTHDLDFSAILAATNAEKPSVVQIRAADLSPERLAPILATSLRQCREALAAGALVSVDADKMRLRQLPLIRD